MADVFFNPYSGQGQTWSLQNCWLGIDATTGDGVLAATQSVQVQYQRAVNTRYPLMAASAKKGPIKILGIPTGTCTLTTILGPATGVQAFLAKFGNTCKNFTLTIKQQQAEKSFGADCETAIEPQTLTLKGCLGTQLSYQISMQDNLAIAQGTFVLVFDALTWASA